ncbi:hypothetical protein DFP72DRAFT_1077748 [Ephemerocybe angulata]|uniref:Amine oxidase domain-containing protein n=1 Tax=Ephemerocybe angulata TaxID=980116 RepID=A0A8H6HFE2_9AGAR|nr:hypothetical protein DFP72DRAFT_1077748 [Tulosesus angulatus]
MPRIDTPATRQDVFAQYGRNIAQTMVDRKKASLPPFIAARSFGSLSADAAAPHPPQFCVKSTHEGVVPVGILGGGMAGLYAALMLAHHKDVGAMRFPLPKKGEIGPHLRLKQLFDYLKLPLFDYIYKNDTGLMYFNEVHSTIGDTEQRFRAKELNVPDPYIAAGVDVLCKDFIDPLAELLLSDMENGGDSGWKILKGQYDRYSTRSYLQFGYVPSEDLQTKYGIPGTGLPTSVINWMETFDKSSGWYDRALLETVLEALAFGAVGPTPDWHCIKHGTSVLPNATLAKIKELARDIPGMPSELIVMQSPVTSIVASDPDDKTSPLVVTAGGQQYTYSHVMSTVPLPNFALMNTSSLSMTVMQRNAIRQLQYGPSIKVGMLFKYPWWKDYKQVGGQSFTDLPVRTIVYPSYGDGQSSNVLIASYCWTNDAEKLGNLIGTGVDKLLDDLVLRNLATVHGVDVEFLRKQHVKTYSWNWNHNAWTGGAFAFFGPGQYDYLYNALNGTAADGRLQWAGELLSVRHAWIVGALDSAWAAVNKYLYLSNNAKELPEFYLKWGTNLEWDTGVGVGKSEGSLPEDGPENKLKIPHTRNLLLHHMLAENPELAMPLDEEE